jgi:hypothetical protein
MQATKSSKILSLATFFDKHIPSCGFFFTMAQQPLLGQGIVTVED